MTRPLAQWFGLAGVPADDNPRAIHWQRRLHPLMVAIALLSIPAYVLDSAALQPGWGSVAETLDAVIFAAFLGELLWMLRVTSFPGRYFLGNWLNVIIIASSLVSLLGATIEWIALVRVLRVALVGLVSMRALAEFRVLFTPRGAPLLVGIAILVIATAGGLLYWLEPTIESYWDGLWLAFVTGTTVGYGDFVPTTPASRLVAAFVVLTGVALIAVFTANIVAVFVGEDEKRLRRALHDDVQKLRTDLARLIDNQDLLLRHEFHREIRALRADIAAIRGAPAEAGSVSGDPDPPSPTR